MKITQLIFAGVGLSAASAAGTAFADPPAQSLDILGKCLDLPNSVVTDGTGIEIWDCNGGQNQQWEFWGDGTVRPSFNTAKCLDLPNHQTTNGTRLEIWDCDGGTNQQWTLGSDGTLRGYGNKCIDDPNSVTTDGTFFDYWTCNGGANQDFTFTPGVTAILNRWRGLGGSGGVLGSPTSGMQINSHDSSGNAAVLQDFQKGFIQYEPDGDNVVFLGSNEVILTIPAINFSGDIVGSGAPMVVTMFSNGGWEFTGAFHNGGSTLDLFGSENDALAIGWRAADGTVFAFTHNGNTSPENRDDSWNNSGTNAALAADWNNVTHGWSYTWKASTSTDINTLWNDVQALAGAAGVVTKVVAVVGAL